MLKIGSNENISVGNKKRSDISFKAWERTLLALKPDAFEKGLAQTLEKEVLKKTGLSIVKEWVGKPAREVMEKHYSEHNGKGFFNELINYVTRGKFKAVVLEGDDAVSKLRATAFELRAKYAPNSKTENLIHSSDSVQSAQKEILNFFG